MMGRTWRENVLEQRREVAWKLRKKWNGGEKPKEKEMEEDKVNKRGRKKDGEKEE